MRKNTQEVMNAFYAGNLLKKCEAIHTDGTTIFSYQTPIAKKVGFDRAVVTEEKYSNTTTIHTNGILVSLQEKGFKVERISERELRRS